MIKSKRLDKMTDVAIEKLSSTFNGDDDILIDSVNNGVCTLLEINGGESYAILRVDDDELVCCCYAGKNVIDFADFVMTRAKSLGYDKFRFHTKRPALGKMLKATGFELSEYVFKYNLQDKK